MFKNKRVIIPLAIVLVIIIAAAALFLNAYFHPDVMISRAVSSSSDNFDGEYHSERIMVVVSGNDWMPTAKSVEEHLNEIHEWNEEVLDEIAPQNYISPYNITVSGEVAGGKTTLRYEGYLTEKDGTTRDYKNERTFDFVVAPNEKLFK